MIKEDSSLKNILEKLLNIKQLDIICFKVEKINHHVFVSRPYYDKNMKN